jgi:hypothetical protein
MHSINYRGLVLNIEINEDITKVSYVKNSNNYVLDIEDIKTFKTTKEIIGTYTVQVTDDQGGNLGKTPFKRREQNTVLYNQLWNLQANRSQGDFNGRGTVDFALEDHFKEQVFPFDKDNNYNKIQPIIFDVDILANEMTVNLVNFTVEKTINYSLDNENWKTENVFSNLEDGEHTIYVKYTDSCTFYKKFVINTVEEV